jgi:putative membrane protein
VRFLAVAISGVLMISATAMAQDPGGDSAQKGQLSATDAAFMKHLAQGGMAEVKAGKLASEKGSADSVRKFGQQMVRDHTKNDRQLEQLARTSGVTLPTAPDDQQRAQSNQLRSTSGAGFDAAYIKAQVKDHQATVKLLEHEISNGQDPAVQQFARQTLPVVQHHLAMATRLEDTLPSNTSTVGH